MEPDPDQAQPQDRHEGRRLVLASGSRYRRAVLEGAGYVVEVDPPQVDERAFDHLLHERGPGELAGELARRKCLDVAHRHGGAVVLAGDQVGVLDTAGRPVLLSKTPDEDSAVAQLLSMSGTVHRLHSALAVGVGPTGPMVVGVDVATVTMRDFDRDAAARYVERFAPHDTAGSYRLEDQEEMEPHERLVLSVDVEHPSGVMGLPLRLLSRLLDRLDEAVGADADSP